VFTKDLDNLSNDTVNTNRGIFEEFSAQAHCSVALGKN
jgi:hypothetical protein